MLFRNDHEPSCSYCANGAPVGEENIICVKKGIVKPWGKCRRFSYDPLKRVPEAPELPSGKELREEDFQL